MSRPPSYISGRPAPRTVPPAAKPRQRARSPRRQRHEPRSACNSGGGDSDSEPPDNAPIVWTFPLVSLAELEEREGVFWNAIGAVWLAAIGRAITIEDAQRLDRELKRIARLAHPIEPRVQVAPGVH
jgi:hypothetical protein